MRPHGVSDHFPWREKLRDDDDVLRYIDDAARLGLRVGLEYDIGVAPPLRATTRASLHYMIGAMHQLEVDGVLDPVRRRRRFHEGQARRRSRNATDSSTTHARAASASA